MRKACSALIRDAQECQANCPREHTAGGRSDEGSGSSALSTARYSTMGAQRVLLGKYARTYVFSPYHLADLAERSE